MAKQPSRRAAKRPPKTAQSVRPLSNRRRVRWDIVGAVVVIIALIGLLGYRYVPKYLERVEAEKYSPSSSQPDPADRIDGVVKKQYPAGQHVRGPQRVAYGESPPFGGTHDQYWATCTGLAYPQPIRSENAVHSLEHGAVWITYRTDLDEGEVASLKRKVDGKPYMLMSPYPGLTSAVSLQAWGISSNSTAPTTNGSASSSPRCGRTRTPIRSSGPVAPPWLAGSIRTCHHRSTRRHLAPTPPPQNLLRRFRHRQGLRGAAVATEASSAAPVAAAASPRRRGPVTVVLVIAATLALGLVSGFVGRGLVGEESAIPASDSVDVGFAQDMSIHHAQAVEMSSIALSQSGDQGVRTLAYDVLTTQQSQIGTMQGWLRLWDRPPVSDRPSMHWMNWAPSTSPMSMPGHSMRGDGSMRMPGMATSEELAALRRTTGSAFDTLYIQLLLRHHEGGLAMARYARDNATVLAVISLAGQIDATQSAESQTLRQLLAERNIAPLPMN